jgi:hypothetical protein
MARPSKLTPDQWREIERRLGAGAKAADLSREYGISQTRISERITKVSGIVSETARKLADAQNALAQLPVAQQYAAVTLADKLRGMSDNLASAAELGAKTAHRLHSLANTQINKVDDTNPTDGDSVDAIKAVAVMVKVANDSSQLAVNLIGANKDVMVKDTEAGGHKPMTSEEISEEMKRRGISAHLVRP